ncbi:hypothetical protein GH714_012884 [Hevea brasiliensis]|uniref:Myb/SANT-like domain-containing protein n=1 Tax=Hevea brasiliensis TaxID=3981 RepID=A0A6A6KBH0_HEVBR|nr:hypothetical protein GH714_012884 [Hevea brasiliensis]
MATKNKGAGRVAWSSEQFNLFVKICVRGTNLGKRNGGGWGDKGYTWLQNELRQVGVEYTKEQLRHKWDWMKDQWKMWKALKGNETGLGWDPIKGTVVAPDEWWNEKIKENSNFARFREKGIGQELYENYQELFLGTVATGEFAYAPSSGVLPNETQETQQFNTADHVEENINAESNFDDDLNEMMNAGFGSGGSFSQAVDMNVVQRMIWDDDDDEVWQTTTYAVDIICSYYLSYIHKEPCMDSFHTGLVWLQEIMRDPTFSNIPPEILNDDRYMPHFKDCIGAIDGTHVSACVQEENLIRFIGWKILRTMPPYSFYVQRDIVVVSMALYYYIRRKALADPAFERLDKSLNFIPPDIFRDADDIQAEKSSQESGALQINALRDQIACSLMLANNDY